jgi:dolichol-phosphate mannosyltransferase
MALASGVSILFGLQLIMFGVLSDLVVTANREQMRRLDRISEKLEELDGESPRTGTADTDTVTTASEADDTEQKADPKQEQH